jgi:hypothetical protein
MFGTNIPWPNPHNSLDTIYWIFTGRHLEITNGWASIFYLFQELQLSLVIASALLLVIFIYLHIKLERLHDAAHERRHEAEYAIASATHARSATNPNRARWEQIMQAMTSPNPNDWKSAIMNADVMLDTMLTENGFVGADVGEKLRSAATSPHTSIEAAWEAHRIRNRIAHGGPDYDLSERDAKLAVDNFRRVFEEFGYI